jgi:hypothetical protein
MKLTALSLEQNLDSETMKPIVEYGLMGRLEWRKGFLISRGFLFWYSKTF